MAKNALDLSNPSVDDSTPNVTRVSAVATPGVNTGAAAPQFQGNAANDTPDLGAPLKIGGKASSVPPADVTIGDRVDAWFMQNGAQATYDAYMSDEDIDSITTYAKELTYTRLTADGVVSAAPIGFAGYIVEASGTGVISVYDNASAASGSAWPLAKAVAANDVVTFDTPISLVNGLYFDLVSGTATVWILTRKRVAA